MTTHWLCETAKKRLQFSNIIHFFPPIPLSIDCIACMRAHMHGRTQFLLIPKWARLGEANRRVQDSGVGPHSVDTTLPIFPSQE